MNQKLKLITKKVNMQNAIILQFAFMIIKIVSLNVCFQKSISTIQGRVT